MASTRMLNFIGFRDDCLGVRGNAMIIIIEIMLAVLACMILAGVILFVARMIGTMWGK